MKKRYLFLIFIFCAAFLSYYRAFAVIQTSPKREHIELNVEKTAVPPVVDGIVGEDEYIKLDITDDMISYVVASEADWARIKKTEFEAYAAVCGGRFFIAVEYRLDPEYRKTECDAKNMWAQSCLLMSFAGKGASGRCALELGIREDGRYIWRLSDGGKTPVTEQSVRYGNGVYTYEFSIDIASFCDEEDGFLFCFSISAGDFYNNGRYAYIQFGKGISGFSSPDNADAGKDASLFPQINITERQAQTGVETEIVPETEPEIPHSGDDGLILITVTVAAIFAAFAGLSAKYGKNLFN